MADILTATPLPTLGVVKVIVDLHQTWQVRNANPYFETDISNWSVIGGTLARSTLAAHEGVASMLFTPDGVSASVEARSEAIPVFPGQQVRASSWLRPQVTRSINVGIIWRDASSVFLSSTLAAGTINATTWGLVDGVATAPAGAAFAQLVISMGGTPPSSNAVRIDEAKLSTLSSSIVSNLPAELSSDLVHIYRVLADSTEHEIIGSPVQLSAGQAILYDTTAPFDVDLTYKAVVNNATVLTDDFTRTVTGNWGVADSGSAWTVDAGASTQHLTNGTQGVHRVAAVNTLYRSRAGLVPMSDIDVKTSVLLTATPAGGYIATNLGFRVVDGSNYYMLQTRTFNGGAVQVFLKKVVAGAETTLTSTTLPQPFFTPGVAMILEAQAVGTTLRARVWNDGQTVPDWQLVTSDSTYTQGDVSIGTIFDPLNTSTLPYDVRYDTVRAYLPTPASFFLAAPIQLVAGRDGWVRDPQDPTLSVRLDNCAEHTFACLNAANFVFFQGLEDEEYDSATGVFDVIDSEFPVTVAQVRKSATSVLRVVSTTLDDIPRLKDLFRSGRDLVLSLPADYGWAVEDNGTARFTAGNVTVSRLNQRDMRKPQRRWSVPLRVASSAETYPTGVPAGNNIPVPGATYQDFINFGLTYDDLSIPGTTYLEWSQGVIY